MAPIYLVGVQAALLTEADDDVHEATVVLDALERATLRLFLLFLLGDLRGLTTNLDETRKREEKVSLSAVP